MNQHELLYRFDGLTITMVLLFLIILLNEIGFRIGRFIQHRTDAEIKTLTGSIQASILGLLALLLGFTFSMSMQRYDDRSQAVIEEANAIGTAVLRVQLLPAQYQSKASGLLNEYIELRITDGKVDLTKQEIRNEYERKIVKSQQALWSLAVLAAHEDPRPVTTGAFITALNDVIDAQGKRNALLEMHVPPVVLFLLYVVFISSGAMLGYSSGLSGKRVIAPTVMVSFLIAMIVFIIIDLDRPRRGLIRVDQNSLLELYQQNGNYLPNRF